MVEVTLKRGIHRVEIQASLVTAEALRRGESAMNYSWHLESLR